MAVDLHTHSTASDGTYTPTELMQRAEAIGLSAVALTDHDTVAGLDEFLGAAKGAIEAIPGVEVAASWYATSLHIVGLFVDQTHPELLELLQEVRFHREERNREILRLLAGLGIHLTREDLQEVAGSEVIGRPHFARLLVARGVVADRQQAFGKLLGTNRPAYVRRFLPMPERVIRTLREAGAVTVFAHPLGGGHSMQPSRLRRTVRQLVDFGLDAIETHYVDYSAEDAALAKRTAKEFGLLESGGSDFHGANMDRIDLGTGRGKLMVPDTLVPPLRERSLRHRRSRAIPKS